MFIPFLAQFYVLPGSLLLLPFAATGLRGVGASYTYKSRRIMIHYVCPGALVDFCVTPAPTNKAPPWNARDLATGREHHPLRDEWVDANDPALGLAVHRSHPVDLMELVFRRVRPPVVGVVYVVAAVSLGDHLCFRGVVLAHGLTGWKVRVGW